VLNVFHLLLGQVASTALGPAEFGVYFLVLATSTFAYVVGDCGHRAVRRLRR
jgi:hypothetical protein